MPVLRVRKSTGAAAQSAIVNVPSTRAVVGHHVFEQLHLRGDLVLLGARTVGIGRAGVEAAALHEAEREALDLEEGRAEREREAIEELVDGRARGWSRRIEIVAALALREVAQDGVRLGHHEALVLQRRDAPERILRRGTSGPRLRDRHLAAIVGEPELGQQEAHLERVRRDRIVIEQHGRRAYRHRRRGESGAPSVQCLQRR